ncbi:MAG: hypothetical protein JJU16_00220 [Alkalibacterium sp.]|nr:hypothetical protein [Alkalibacterium sp.]
MFKEWSGSKVDVYLEDGATETLVRRSFAGANQFVSEEQVTNFTNALDSVTSLPVSHAVVIEEYHYTK